MTGADLTRIDGIDVMTATTIISEAGWDMSKWRTEDHFASWLRLCPDNRISGDKVIGKGRLPTNNRLTLALKMAASTLRQSDTYLGAQFRRLRMRLGAPVAIKAMAAKLARLVYRMLRYGMQFVDRGAQFYEKQHRQRQIDSLKQKAAEFGFEILRLLPRSIVGSFWKEMRMRAGCLRRRVADGSAKGLPAAGFTSAGDRSFVA